MSRFIQLHFLTAYAPSNLNRDDLGRPKTAVFGGTQRLRVSSQSLKRAWRTSEPFKNQLEGHIGVRTREVGSLFFDRISKGLDEKKAAAVAQRIAERFGKPADGGKPGSISQLAHLTRPELLELEKLTGRIAAEKTEPTKEELDKLLSNARGTADVALFGRMLADATRHNVDAACQVAHALSVHKVAIEDDFFSAVDDLNTREEDAGAGHLGTHEFAAAVLYHYVCIDRALLIRNLEGDEALAAKTLRAFVEACLTVAPSGKQNSFGSRARASYALAEKGDTQPRSLAVSFLKPVTGLEMMPASIAQLATMRANMDKVYGAAASATSEFNVETGTGTIGALLDFVAEG